MKKLFSSFIVVLLGLSSSAAFAITNIFGLPDKTKEKTFELYKAISKDNEDYEGAKKAIDKGAAINVRYGMYRTPLGTAAAKCHPKIVKLLLEKGAKVDPGPGNGIPLALVAQVDNWEESNNRHFKVVKLLIEAGAKKLPKEIFEVLTDQMKDFIQKLRKEIKMKKQDKAEATQHVKKIIKKRKNQKDLKIKHKKGAVTIPGFLRK